MRDGRVKPVSVAACEFSQSLEVCHYQPFIWFISVVHLVWQTACSAFSRWQRPLLHVFVRGFPTSPRFKAASRVGSTQRENAVDPNRFLCSGGHGVRSGVTEFRMMCCVGRRCASRASRELDEAGGRCRPQWWRNQLWCCRRQMRTGHRWSSRNENRGGGQMS